jgi:hypothetical protein
MSERQPAFYEEDLRAHFDPETSNFVNIQPKPFQIGVDPEIKPNSTITIFGRRGTGKSFWVRWFMSHYKYIIPWVYCFTKTKFNNFYANHMPEKFIIHGYKPAVLRKVWDSQKAAVDDYGRGGDKNPMIANIWDDCMDDKVKYDDTLREFYYESRHLATLNFMCCQWVTSVGPGVRANTDYVVILKCEFARQLEELWKDYAPSTEKNAFYAMVKRYTQDDGFLFIVNDPRAPQNNVWYFGKAEEVPRSGWDAVWGSKEMWKGSERQLKEILNGNIEKFQDRIGEISKFHQSLRKEENNPNVDEQEQGKPFPAHKKLA